MCGDTSWRNEYLANSRSFHEVKYDSVVLLVLHAKNKVEYLVKVCNPLEYLINVYSSLESLFYIYIQLEYLSNV